MNYLLLYQYKCTCGNEWSAVEPIAPPSDPRVLARLVRPTECPTCERSVDAYPLVRQTD